MAYRGHEPIELSTFNGLWDRGDDENTPPDHFKPGTQNVWGLGGSSVQTRYGLGRHQDLVAPLGNVVRIYNYVTQDKNTYLALTWDGTTGNVYHIESPTVMYGPILTKAGMEDFAFVPYAGRAYISPFKSYLTGGLYIEKGLQNEFVYVYAGDGTAARKIAGDTPAGTLTVANGAAGHTDAGLHIFAVVGETNSGFLSAPVAFKEFTTVAASSVSFSNIPTFTGAQWTKRHIVATIVIPTYNGNLQGYQFFFIPLATLNDNITTVLPNVSFYDQDLFADAGHLLDNYSEVPAGAVLAIYHGRLVVGATYTDISLLLVSARGEPEAISQIDGLVVIPLDGNPVTNGAELRDVFYVTKRNKTFSVVDNDDVPSTWIPTLVDPGLGAPVHGIATVLDQGSANVNFLLMATYKGIIIFNGVYQLPELTWKIDNFWQNLDRVNFRYIQMVNDSIESIIWTTLPDRTLLKGEYRNGLDAKNIKWWPQVFDVKINTVALLNTNELILGAEGIL